MIKTLSPGVVHGVPADLRKALASAPAASAAWEDISPLARNEWICWVESCKKAETRSFRIERTRAELMGGKRRPCCWAGCPHRRTGRRIFLFSLRPIVYADGTMKQCITCGMPLEGDMASDEEVGAVMAKM
ncbi:hypothetical protein A2856_01955 [Candidatus Uhrbacteria bacterium RIFCSPHIGHO2_01_FULL_63_20]|uniref:Uncharacterized protein n=1 Tax=Candidatus Uhrbacteria bacterium RIFCSPHIGHO2_01_FULL_63_20 TaxID=1802385 RepID=A0A1F7TKC7_9BACT|nr:MAG: hypothetical protein A2856_01955 [Candidatus Uhrbacteria bacterium RIFCSPHIGHO2_01_FULL_63_20]